MTTRSLEWLNKFCAVIGLLALCVVLGMPAETPFLPRMALGFVFAFAVLGSTLLMREVAERARRRDEASRRVMRRIGRGL